MDKYKKKLFMILILITLISFIIVIILHSSFENKDLINKNLMQKTLEKNLNDDYGYYDLPNIGLYESDELYFTYYSLLCLEYLQYDKKQYVKLLVDNFGDYPIDLLFSENNYDNITNIYYYVEIAKLLNIHINYNMKNKISDYLKDLKTYEGGYALSRKQLEGFENNSIDIIYRDQILPTYLVLNIIKSLNIETYDITLLNKWLYNEFYIYNNSDITEYNLSYVLLLSKISKIINNNSDELNELLEKYYNNIIKGIDDDFNIILINDLIDTCIELNKENELIKYKEKLKNNYKKLQNDNGCFSIEIDSDSNILPTYYALKFYDLIKSDPLNKKTIVDTIINTQMYNGFFIPIQKRETKLISTYYTYKIAQLCNLNNKDDILKNVSRYINNINISDIDENQQDLMYYFKIYYDIHNRPYCNNEISNNLLKQIKSELNVNTLSSYSLCIQAINCLEILECFKVDLEENLYNAILNRIINRSIEQLNDYQFACYDLIILDSIKAYDDSLIYNRLKIIKDTFSDNFRSVDEKYLLYDIYFGLLCLNKYDITVSYNKQLFDYLNNCKIGAVFSYNSTDYPTLESTYMAIYIITNLK